ncbi:MAG: aminotransferase class I/II-fold pyridoxal phosphate-dependent enzyme [Patescibacteria group bacterium]
MLERSPGRTTKNPIVVEHAARIAKSFVEEIKSLTDEDVKRLLDNIFDDPTLRKDFQGMAIRHAAMCGEVAKEVLAILESNPDQIELMALGDVDLPDFAREVVKELIQEAHRHHHELNQEYGSGYDLTAQGAPKARESVMRYFDPHYGFSAVPGLSEKLTKNSTITAGAMRGLKDIAESTVYAAENSDPPQRPRFIQPDNSFGTWHEIVKRESHKGKTAEVHTLATNPEHLLHLTPEQVRTFYREHLTQENHQDTWCITPVGNPSGTHMKPEQLGETCRTIIEYNPKAKIILDCTYVRTLKPEKAQELMRGVITDPEIMNRVVFVESFSKTHGFCRERIGMYFSANEEIFKEIQNTNTTNGAGNGQSKEAFVFAIASATSEQEAIIRELHEFWGRERKGLYHYLIRSGNFENLFEEEQNHIEQEQLGGPQGLYLFVKLKPGVTAREVLLQTKCLGVETQMGSGKYVRFAVGKIKKPTYAKYAPQETEAL